MQKVEICLPIKDEEAIIKEKMITLAGVLRDLKINVSWILTGAVNGSSDQSFNVFQNVVSGLPYQNKCFNLVKRGKAHAIKTCWQQSEADILVFMDIDLAVPPIFLRQLLLPIINDEADLVIGSRFLPDSQTSRSWRRDVISRFYIFIAKLILKHGFTDLQCGFKAIRRSSYQKLEKFLKDDSWFLDSELLVFAKAFDLKVLEIPVIWHERDKQGKKSNIKIIRDSFNFIFNLFRLRARKNRLVRHIKIPL
jgi:glycosyltransferase involved in cell wall biosynthesis